MPDPRVPERPWRGQAEDYLFVMSGLTGTPIMAIARRAVPFVFMMILISIVVGFVPWLSTWWMK